MRPRSIYREQFDATRAGWIDWVSLGALVATFAVLGACSPVHDVADKAYGKEIDACVESAKTLAESKACRAQVNQRWGIVTVEAKDAGHE